MFDTTGVFAGMAVLASIVLPDHVGSAAPRMDYTMELLARAVDAVLDHAQVARAGPGWALRSGCSRDTLQHLTTARGVGYLIAQAESVLDTTGVCAGIAVLAAIVLMVSYGVGRLERYLLRWKKDLR